jgi:hypothetical protein
VINCIYRWLFVVIFSIVSLTTFSQNFKYNYPCPKDTKNIKVPIIQLDIIDTVYVDNLYNNQIILPEKENKLIEDNEFIFYIIIVIFITIILLLMNYFFKKINNILNTLD